MMAVNHNSKHGNWERLKAMMMGRREVPGEETEGEVKISHLSLSLSLSLSLT
jgi:hypothetical protein